MVAGLDKIFMPSESFLNAVGKTPDNRLFTIMHNYDSINLLKSQKRDVLKYIMDSANDMVDSSLTGIEKSLVMPFPSDYIPYDEDVISAVLIELMFNSYIHSPAKIGLHIKSFYGMNFGLGIFDGGSFYRQDWVKKSIESKTNILPNEFPSELNLEGSGTNRGIRNLYKYGDFIEIDTTKGVLYITIAREAHSEGQI